MASKETFIKNQKIELAKLLLLMHIAQVAAFLSVPAVMFIIWDKFFTNDVLYLCGWWAVIGLPIAAVIFIVIGESIKSYKKTSLKNIYRNAKRCY